ncbi:MAG: type I-E CRISPR-associated protein Cse1/CasA [Euzebyales bacterium]|nr:type I-E CRISPR-associated protein Cse1/CasA [Euzebyales bacterium]
MRFSLVEEPWIPVVRGGEPELVSLRDALRHAHDIQALTAPVGTQIPAMLRQVLLPVIIHATDLPAEEEEWGARWSAGRFDPEVVDAYLDEHAERFYLFHSDQPFAQVGDLRTAKDETKPSSLLIPSEAGGNNVPLFSSRTEAEAPTLTAAEAARWLLHVHCWDTAAIKTGVVGDPKVKNGKTTGNPTGPLGQLGVVIPTGRTLFETLLLNVPIQPDGLELADRPQWQGPVADATWSERPVRGLLDLLTWQARRVRLIPEEGQEGLVVRRVIVAAGDRQPPAPDVEPHTTWVIDRKPKAGQPPRRPRRLRAGYAAWRGLEALIAIQGPGGQGTVETSRLLAQVADLREDQLDDTYPLTVLNVGAVYGNQSAVVEHVIVDALALPVAALRSDVDMREFLTGVVNQVDGLAKAVNFLAADLRRALGGEGVPWDQGQRPDVAVVHELDPLVRRLLAGLQHDPGQRGVAQRAWEQAAFRVVRAVADALLDAVPPAAFAGRERDKRRYVPAVAEQAFRSKVADLLPHRHDRADADQLHEEAS